MKVYKSYVIVNVVVSSLLALLYSVILIKELCGPRYKVIVTITLMLLINNLLMLFLIGSDLAMIVPNQFATNDKTM